MTVPTMPQLALKSSYATKTNNALSIDDRPNLYPIFLSTFKGNQKFEGLKLAKWPGGILGSKNSWSRLGVGVDIVFGVG